MVANLKQRAIRCAAVIAVAMAAGQFVQSTSKPAPKPKLASDELSVKPVKLATVAAGVEATTALAATKIEPARLPVEPVAIIVPAPVVAPPLNTPPLVAVSAAEVPPLDQTPTPQPQASFALPKDLPTSEQVLEKAFATNDCPTSLDLSVTENAIIGVTLIASCHPDERVVLKHAGLTVTAMTTLTGAIFADLPALDRTGKVEVQFKDGTSISNSIDVPEIAKMRRFAIEWQAEDSFALHGFENGADIGDKGDISAANTNRPASGVPAAGGFLSILGDSSTENALLAEVYTYPTDSAVKADVVVEAAVTETSCGREMLGETLLSQGGTVTTSDLTVSMPDCDAIGDYLVLNNLVPDMNIASSD